MRIGPVEITRAKAIATVSGTAQLQSVASRGGWWPIIRESFTGAWQQNIEITVANVTTHPAVFACTTQIANDIAKMRLRLVQQDENGIWNETSVPSFTPVLRKPNHYQNRIQFIANWLNSKLLNGNTYVLKVRDASRDVRSLYLLDPQRVRVLVAPNGEVFYELKKDDLSQLPAEAYTVPASEIIHDHWNELFHPLVGLSPIYACGLAAVQGLNIQQNSTNFFGNGSNAGGVIEVPGAITTEAAERIKDFWDSGFSGDNSGKVAVLADGMKYVQMKMSAVDSQLIEQLKWTAEVICATFHVPTYMVGFGPPPSYNNIEALSQQYYSQCLQILIESIELCLDEGLGLTTGEVAAKRYGTEFDIDDLLRMDSATMMKTIGEGVKVGVTAPNEGRKKLNMGPVAGGQTPYLQQQNYSLEALAKRDAQADPFAAGTAAPAPASSKQPDDDEEERAIVSLRLKAFSELGVAA